MAFQLHSLTECTSCSEEEDLSHFDDYEFNDEEDEEEYIGELEYDSDSINKKSRKRIQKKQKGHRARGQSNTLTNKKSNLESESKKYRVIEELELDKYELESEPWFLSTLHQLAGGNLLSPLQSSQQQQHQQSYYSSNTESRKSKKVQIPDFKCNSSGDCKLCNLLSPRPDDSLDYLDTETVTLMDVLERLSRILAQKAKQLISNRKRKQVTIGQQEVDEKVKVDEEKEKKDQEEQKGEEGKIGQSEHSTNGLEDDKEIQCDSKGKENEQVEVEEQVEEMRNKEKKEKEKGSSKCHSEEVWLGKKKTNPLKDLKDSGIAVKKVENRKRLIILKDGPTQYWIQGKERISLSHAHPSFAVSTFLPFLFLLVRNNITHRWMRGKKNRKLLQFARDSSNFT